MKRIKDLFFHVCPKTGRVIGLKPLKQQLVWMYPLIGLAALIWFLVRVVPKPSRANYPCQRVAMPLALSFMTWVVGYFASAMLLRKVHKWFTQKRFEKVALCLAIGMFVLSGDVVGAQEPSRASYTPHTVNAPIGVAQGLEPGRVIWVHDTDITDWAGPNSGQRWYEHVNQDVADDMMSWALRGYANQSDDADAWNAIFNHYNGDTGYTPGEKILIKINLTTANAGGAFCDDNYNQLVKSGVTLDSTANTPQLLVALVDQLVNVVGVSPADITLTDPTGLFVNYLYYPLHDAFPTVKYEDNRGGTGPEGESTRRARAEYTSPCVPYYWSTSDADGTTQDCVVQSFYDATYIINYAVLKSHDRAGITVAAKNHYGSLMRTPIGGGRTLGSDHYDLHDRLPLQPLTAAWQNMGYYRPLVDLMGNEYIGGKTVLYLVDGIFAGKGWNSTPSTWSMAPFNGDWPSSLFLSMDPVAIDSVGFDFLSQQWPDQVLAYEGVQDFLHEAAQANNPPSGTFYDPERDSERMQSLGVHEHWNNATDKEYSRNLGSGDGIELLYITSDPGQTTHSLTMAVNPSGAGTTTPSIGAHDYAENEVVDITANPAAGYAFLNWTGGVEDPDSASTTVTMTADMSVTANFAAQVFTISGNAGIAGATVNFSGGTPVLANGAGDYSITVPYNWSGTVTPSFSGYTFTPAFRTYSSVVAGQSGQNYTATLTGHAFQISLSPGWNLVSFNLHPTSTAIADVLADITGKYALVFAWDASGAHSTAGNWMKYDPSVGFGNSLTTLDEKQAFWIYMNTADTLDISGTIPTTTTILLDNAAGGWNLVGYPSNANGDLPAALNSHGVTAYTLIYAYHASDSGDPWKLFDQSAPIASDLKQMTAGWGYWIYVTADAPWQVNY